MVDFTLLDDGRPVRVQAVVGGRGIRLAAPAVHTALGWELKPQGLCRGDTCIPIRLAPPDDGIDLATLAAALGRPLALDVDERAAALGASAEQRSGQLRSLEAPDFVLPDLAGREHRLDEQRGRKLLLLAWASW
jgi:hypothetical protein